MGHSGYLSAPVFGTGTTNLAVLTRPERPVGTCRVRLEGEVEDGSRVSSGLLPLLAHARLEPRDPGSCAFVALASAAPGPDELVAPLGLVLERFLVDPHVDGVVIEQDAGTSTLVPGKMAQARHLAGLVRHAPSGGNALERALRALDEDQALPALHHASLAREEGSRDAGAVEARALLDLGIAPGTDIDALHHPSLERIRRLVAEGYSREAVPELEALIAEGGPFTPEALLVLGRVLSELHGMTGSALHLEKAMATFARLVALGGTRRTSALDGMAELHLSSGQTLAAEELARTALLLSARESSQRLLVLALQAQGRVHEAREVLEKPRRLFLYGG
jgi:hypothetical protein